MFVIHHGLGEWQPSFPLLLISSTLQLKSVIRRTKETTNVHPMYREGLLRRKMGPIIVNKSNSQDRLIEELQGKLGIGRAETVTRRKQQPDDWLTEGVIVMSSPQRTREERAQPSVDKVEIRGAQRESVLFQDHVKSRVRKCVSLYTCSAYGPEINWQILNIYDVTSHCH